MRAGTIEIRVLEKTLRNRLERTVMAAREVADAAARIAVEHLGVGEPKPYAHLSPHEKELRRKLRIHGRQLGDAFLPSPLGRGAGGEGRFQASDRLVEEISYQHWHRMLFARFLAENGLLLYPDPDEPVAVSLEECEDLAAGEGAKNGWELAARFAARMLPQIFRADSPVFQLTLPPEHQQKLERLLADLPQEVFHASDSLGWVYQFWQAKRKDAVNASEVKIGARELPAVTQLFTEPYMVAFLLDNSLGAWWAARRLTETDFRNARTEEELRKKASLPGVPLEYLRFVKGDDGKWTPAAGTFDSWPDKLAQLKSLDPCCGSGHFLVAAFLMLVPMRVERDGLSASEAADAVLRENIHGLEIDQRCVELAAFALALAAWRYPEAGGYRRLPELNVACSGLAVSVAKEEWKQLGLGKRNLAIALDWMHDTFKDATLLGSLLNPAKTEAAKLVQWDELSTALKEALQQEQTDERQEVAVVAQGLAKAATLLGRQYPWVITNVPYLARGKQDQRLRDFCEKHYPAAKNDLATVFLDRCLELCVEGGTSSIVLPQNWLFLTSYRKFREKLLKNYTLHLIGRLGEGGFDSSAAAGAFVAMITLSRGNPTGQHGGFLGETQDTNLIRGLDVSEARSAAEKAERLLAAEIKSVQQAKQLENPDARIVIEAEYFGNLLSVYADGVHGFGSKDSPRFFRQFWELLKHNYDWQLMSTTSDRTCLLSGKEQVVNWQMGKGLLAELARKGLSIPAGEMAWGKKGVLVSQMRELACTLYFGEIFDKNVAVVLPKARAHLPAIWCYCSSPEYNVAVRRIDQKLNVTNATLVKVPFDLDHWTKVAEEKYPNSLPKPYSDDPTQWIFHGHPCSSVIWDEDKKWTAHGPLRTGDTVLQVAVARLLGYRWPAELDTGMELADEQREWVKRCEGLLAFSDKDGIVCIPPVRGEASAADRLLNLLAAAYGKDYSPSVLNRLLKEVGFEDKTLDAWLRDGFFAQHCRLFHQRPFIWHIWDGLSDGFSVLANYHKLGRKNLETLIYTYLGDWIKRQKDDIASGVDGAQERLAAGEILKKHLELILEGEAPYDIFIRWKPMEKQPIGWDPDLNDGVRLNIRPFLSVPDVKARGAGVLRVKPNITWNKDRGKDVLSAPWHPLFKGDRINDHHLSLAEKRAAKEATQ